MSEINPRTLEEAADAISDAAMEGQTIDFRGSGSRSRDRSHDVAIGTAAMDQIVDWLVEDLTVVVEAGVTVGELEQLVNTKQQTTLLPIDQPNRTVGGVVAEGSSGYARLKYGPTRDRVLEVTLATGYGKVVRGGGRLVKNVTGYDLPRLATGSLGSLGFIGSVCLKLWPKTPAERTVRIDDPRAAHEQLYRPVAVLETDRGSFAMIEGSVSDVAVQTQLCGGEPVDEIPEPIPGEFGLSVRVPPRHLSDVLTELRPTAESYTAQHGVGVIDAGFISLDLDAADGLRSLVESLGGSVVLTSGRLDGFDRWGTPPTTMAIQRRLKDLFDPHRVCNPGILPGGI